MKKITRIILIAMLFVVGGSGNIANAQALLKDLNPGNESSGPEGFITVNGSMYFITRGGATYVHKLWKSDGTAANTVLVKDSLIVTSINGVITLLNMNNTLYFFKNSNGSATTATRTELWKSDGTTGGTVLIDSLKNVNPLDATGDAPPRNYTVAGNKIFFQMGSGHGLELWVTDGTKSGTMEVIDLNPAGGTFKMGGVVDKPMAAFNGKVYFQGTTNALGKDVELYESDGTPGGTKMVKDIRVGAASSDPGSWIIYKNELYFYAYDGTADGIWKTDGTNTTLMTTGAFNSPVLFKNMIYFVRGIDLWKSDGTSGGTAFVIDSANTINGANDDYLVTQYMKPLSVPPYYEMLYKKTDGNTSVVTSLDIGASASFIVRNNKMYHGISDGRGLWVTDGTDGGTSQLATNISNYLHVFNGNIFYNGFGTGTGYELWVLDTASTGGIIRLKDEPGISVYPNPSSGLFTFVSKTGFSEIKIYNLLGEIVYSKNINSATVEINLTDKPKGAYFYVLTDDNGVLKNGKIIVE